MTLWEDLGVRPMDAPTWTLDEALVIEIYAIEAERAAAAARSERRRADARKRRL